MKGKWGVIGSGYMAREYCKALLGKSITPQVFCRDLESRSVAMLRAACPQLTVRELDKLDTAIDHWLVCTAIESHDAICAALPGHVYCEKPYSHDTRYDPARDYAILVNRRYYYWVEQLKSLIDGGRIEKIIASIPEKGAHTLITQGIHVIDLLWYLAGAFGPAQRVGKALPSYMFSTAKNVSVVVNMNYGAHENFSLRFYAADGTVYEAKPIEACTVSEGMEVRQPDDALPIRTYKPVTRALEFTPTPFKPGLGELLDDLIEGRPHRLPSLAQHHQIHRWIEDNMV